LFLTQLAIAIQTMQLVANSNLDASSGINFFNTPLERK